MIRIRSIKIKAYKSCVHTNLKLNSDLTALIGINGSGKSTILNSLLLLKKVLSVRHRYDNKQRGSNKSSITLDMDINDKPIILKSTIFYNTDEDNLDDVVSAKIDWDVSSIYPEIKESVSLPPEILYYHHNYPGHVYDSLQFVRRFGLKDVEDKTIQKLLPLMDEVYKYLSGIKYYSASQFSNPSNFPNFIELDDESEYRSWNSAKSSRVIFDLYREFKNNSREYEQFINIIGNTGLKLIDTIEWNDTPIPSVSYTVKSGGQPVLRQRDRLLVIPIINIGKNKLSPNQLSEGTLRTLALVFYIITDKSNLLLIEEPEVSVHHGLLSSLITLIKNQSKRKQILISTHSDYVLDELEPEDIVFVQNDSKKGTLATQLKEAMSKKEREVLKEYLAESGNLGEYWREGGFDNV